MYTDNRQENNTTSKQKKTIMGTITDSTKFTYDTDTIERDANALLSGTDYMSVQTADTLVALATIGHAWKGRSANAKKLADYMSTDEYGYECNGFCHDAALKALPFGVEHDAYDLDDFMAKSGMAIAYKGDDEKHTVEEDPDSTEAWRFIFLGDPFSGSDMGLSEPCTNPYRPLAWSTIGIMGLADDEWDRHVNEKDVANALDGEYRHDGYGEYDIVPRD